MFNTLRTVILLLLFIFASKPVTPQPATTNTSDFRSWAQTPPMGWNSYDCYGAAVYEKDVRENAQFMAQHLKAYGWEYVVVDYCWYYPHPPGSTQDNPPQFYLKRDGAPVPWMPMSPDGILLPDPGKFPSAANGAGFKPLADYIHSLGLKFGIHLMRGIPRQAAWAKSPVAGVPGVDISMIVDTTSFCPWLNLMWGADMTKKGAQEYFDSMIKMYAGWGVDFIKVDDVGLSDDYPYRNDEIDAYRKAIDKCGRPIVLSLSLNLPYSQKVHLKQSANMWRISGDFWDDWGKLKAHFALCDKWSPEVTPGTWPDADILPLGLLRCRGPFGTKGLSKFNNDEKKSLITLWSIFRSPLMFGGDLPGTDSLTISMITNQDVLSASKEGYEPRQLKRINNQIIWISKAGNSKKYYIGMFNIGDIPESIKFSLSDINEMGKMEVRDLWKQKTEKGLYKDFSRVVAPHGAEMFLITVK